MDFDFTGFASAGFGNTLMPTSIRVRYFDRNETKTVVIFYIMLALFVYNL